ncbi:hypothetical protein BDW02DRAFT_569407 [Decorospora gaudefroyi]|uniref:Uncharacterized protein n=1 Tax=Decorospora gaudefroyi TaxID=184978 RepID=A0A6A5KI45_9PLEO|nr:hypothetical protein BDW02DRAFT_569407 [Decorospora gaudefroyi]
MDKDERFQRFIWDIEEREAMAQQLREHPSNYAMRQHLDSMGAPEHVQEQMVEERSMAMAEQIQMMRRNRMFGSGGPGPFPGMHPGMPPPGMFGPRGPGPFPGMPPGMPPPSRFGPHGPGPFPNMHPGMPPPGMFEPRGPGPFPGMYPDMPPPGMFGRRGRRPFPGMHPGMPPPSMFGTPPSDMHHPDMFEPDDEGPRIVYGDWEVEEEEP